MDTTKDDFVSDTLTDLMLRNLSEVFGERDSERRMAAIKNLYSEDAVFFEAELRFEGRQTISDAIAALQASFPAEFEFSAAAPPARNHDVGRLFWRLGPEGSPPVVSGMDAFARFTSSSTTSAIKPVTGSNPAPQLSKC